MASIRQGLTAALGEGGVGGDWLANEDSASEKHSPRKKDAPPPLDLSPTNGREEVFRPHAHRYPSSSEFLTPNKTVDFELDSLDIDYTPKRYASFDSADPIIRDQLRNEDLERATSTNLKGKDQSHDKWNNLTSAVQRVSYRIISGLEQVDPDEILTDDDDDTIEADEDERRSDNGSLRPSTSLRPNSPIRPHPYRLNSDGSTRRPVTPKNEADEPSQYLFGRSLRIFAPSHPLRLKMWKLCSSPWFEPLVLLLIILHTVFLFCESSWNIFKDKDTEHIFAPWGHKWTDWGFLAIFILYTLELSAKIIAFGLWDDSQLFYSTGAMPASSWNRFFPSKLTKSSRWKQRRGTSPVISHALTLLVHNDTAPHRVQRAFLRSSWNRVDFISVVCYWISLGVAVNDYDITHQLFLFRFLACLRILRLLNLTHGTTAVLRALKTSAPLLINVSLFIGFFWYVFHEVRTLHNTLLTTGLLFRSLERNLSSLHSEDNAFGWIPLDNRTTTPMSSTVADTFTLIHWSTCLMCLQMDRLDRSQKDTCAPRGVCASATRIHMEVLCRSTIFSTLWKWCLSSYRSTRLLISCTTQWTVTT